MIALFFRLTQLVYRLVLVIARASRVPSSRIRNRTPSIDLFDYDFEMCWCAVLATRPPGPASGPGLGLGPSGSGQVRSG